MTKRTGRSTSPLGSCAFCGQGATRSGMRRHLAACKSLAEVRAASTHPSASPSLLLTVDSPAFPEYWLQLEARPQATLADLDRYLRWVWLECCHHLSAFDFGGERRSSLMSDGWDEAVETMTKPLSRALRPGQSCRYSYDFGRTTQLRVQAWAEVPGRSGAETITLLARNAAPELPCSDCGSAPAVRICTECRYDGCGWLCAECAPKHECGDESQLPVLNSPRTGICGYTGD